MQLKSQFTLIFLLICELAVAAPPIANPNCPESCGNIKIPYPFGIGAGCYLDKWFQIICNETVSPPKTLISSIKMEVLNISLNNIYGDEDRVLVKSPIFSSNCSGREAGVVVNLAGSPFFFSVENSFTAVGCNNRALMTQIEPQVVGCESTCDNNKVYNGQNTKCNGTKCCQITIPTNPRVLNATIGSINASESGDGCKLAFLADDDWFQSTATDPFDVQNMEYVPVKLYWMIFFKNLSSVGIGTSCSSKQYFRYPTSTQCTCNSGYEGNPYLLNGCQDIDECKDPGQKTNCRKGQTCVNEPGSYSCQGNNTWTIILGVGIGVGLFFAIVWLLYKFMTKRKKIILREKFFKQLLQQHLSSSDQGNIESTKVFSSKELKKATDDFNENRVLGQGGQGTVYKGMLVDGRIIAVKKSKLVDERKVREFINEVVILSQINHRNVVKLLGCCLETEVPLLVYEFIPNGNLHQYLHDQNDEFPISWKMRLRIATEVAAAISYLHSAAAIPIYHRDIKSSNILLDEKYKAKVSDFGISRSIAVDQTHLTTNVQGTFGYLDPEYFQTSQFTDKSDVYSFGVVLVELLTGQKPISFARSEDSISLAMYFIISMEENRIFDILDPQVKEHFDNEEVMVVANLAKRCLSLNAKIRPTMIEVTIELERICLLQKNLNVKKNHEDIAYIKTEVSNSWDVASTSTGSGFDSKSALSIDVQPLISNKSR